MALQETIPPTGEIDSALKQDFRAYLGLDVAHTGHFSPSYAFTTRRYGRLSLMHIRAGGREGRARAAIANCERDVFFIYLFDGQFRVHSGGQKVELAPGEGRFFNAGNETEYECPVYSRHAVVRIPAPLLECWIPAGNVTEHGKVAAGSPWGTVLSASLEAAINRPDDGEPDSSGVVPQIMSTLSLASRWKQEDSQDRLQAVALKLRRTLQEEWYGRRFTATIFARAHGISVRYLHLCFAALGSSFEKDLMKARTGHAVMLLSDPAYSGLSVGEIAWRCGFADASHLRRRLKAEGNTSPSTLRHSD